MKDIDGNQYTSVIIGNQEWTVENLQVTHYNNGDIIPNVTDNSQWSSLTTGAWCYYNNDSQYNIPYGKLYNWYTVNDPRGVAPAGWHIPTYTEWMTLINYLGGDSIAGGKLKEVGTSHWLQTENNITNSTCFIGLPAGERNYNISTPFFMMGYLGCWWSSSNAGINGYYNFSVSDNNSYTSIGESPGPEGYSIRCIKN